ncbi:VRR-NUC domain-containing protein [Modicisalibacter muralis]|uniref:VRR-NUC domain-containing protein n=1 Tax=Modicisalibacter muralis TaxID=119000 RepID=A0A1G9MVC1_9GAMM|nr:VRR-NUC domain-containing protein [Halomonas muralis]SDL78169.1 VRR-NUC domain-containing protein [Halomonas muralis]
MGWSNRAFEGTRRKRSVNKDGSLRKNPRQLEEREHAAAVAWLHGESLRGSEVGGLYEPFFHPPNGGNRDAVAGAKLKAQGAKAGVSDFIFLCGRGGWLGLVVEFKAMPPNDARLSDSQRDWLTLSERHGYCAVLARGFFELRAVLQEYAGWPETVSTIDRREMQFGSVWRKGT